MAITLTFWSQEDAHLTTPSVHMCVIVELLVEMPEPMSYLIVFLEVSLMLMALLLTASGPEGARDGVMQDLCLSHSATRSMRLIWKPLTVIEMVVTNKSVDGHWLA